jgi:hypothetical protein
MKKIEIMKMKLRKPDESGLFHDSRGDVRVIMQALNEIISKQNEVIMTVNKLIDLQKV